MDATSSRLLFGFFALITPAWFLAACTPTEREYGATGGGGSSSSSSTSSSSGDGGATTSSSSSSSSGSPALPGDVIHSSYFPNTNALLFDLDVDGNGDSLLAGRFSNVLDFGDGALVDVGAGDIFIARHDRNDKLLFSKSYGSAGPAGVIRGKVSPKGAIYLSGDISDMSAMSFGGSQLKGPGVWQVALGALGSPVAFDLMIGHDMMSYLAPYGVAATYGESSIFTGFYGGSITVNQTSFISAGDSDGYIIKFDSAGQITWAKSIGGIGHDNISAVAVDAVDNNYITGYFTDSIMLGPNAMAITSAGGSDIFVGKLGPAGLPKWVRRIGGPGEEFIYDTIGIGPNGEVVVASRASDVIEAEATMLPPAGGSDVFIAKYSTDGTLAWAKRYGDGLNQFVDSLAVDSEGNILVTGTFEGVIDFGAGPLMAPPNGGAYLAKLDPTGKLIFNRVISGQIDALRVAADGAMSILLAGSGANISFELGKTDLPTGGVFLTRIAP